MKSECTCLMRLKASPASGCALIVVAWVILSIWMTWLYIVPDIALFLNGDHLEFGDFANNALRIRDAKALHEIYGNFSRYGFYHPGPAFWYLYAAGEFLLYDWLGIVSSAPFSHILTGTLFQCACASAVILYLARQTHIVLVPLALAILFIHWHFFRGAPTSIWPPHVLFGPYLLLVVVASAVAAGSLRALPVMIFAGGMLVHGHVAQPLPVLSIGFLALTLCYRARGSFGGSRSSMVAALLIVQLFLLPLALDLVRGAHNFTTILTHLHATSAGRHNLAQGFGYFLGFFRYENTQDTVQGAIDFALVAYLADHWQSWVLPFLFLASGGVLLWQKHVPLQIRYFVLMVFIAATLSVLWSALQDGNMYEFNGNYIYVVVYLVYLLPMIMLALYLKERPRHVQNIAIAAALSALILAINIMPKQIVMATAPSDSFNVGLRHLIADASSLHVVIDPDHWIGGFGVVTALDRMGVNVTVDPVYQFLRGERPALQSADIMTLTVSTTYCVDGVRVPEVPRYHVGQEMVCVTNKGM